MQPLPITLQPVSMDTVPVLAAIHKACFDPGWNAQTLSGLLAMPGSFGLLARYDDFPIGFILARFVLDEAEILTFAVHPRHRRAGTGRTLLAGLLTQAREKRLRTLFLEVGKNNKNAFRLYETMGFTTVGQRSGYYKNAQSLSEDAFIMRYTIENG